MTTDHAPGGVCVDVSLDLRGLHVAGQDHAGFFAGYKRFVDRFDNTRVLVGESAFFFVPPPPRKPRTHAADRTRSPRWLAGSRRTRKLAHAAKRRGQRSRFVPAPSWADLGWTELGWVDETRHAEGVAK